MEPGGQDDFNGRYLVTNLQEFDSGQEVHDVAAERLVGRIRGACPDAGHLCDGDAATDVFDVSAHHYLALDGLLQGDQRRHDDVE